MAIITGCQNKPRILHQNIDYTVYRDKVVQGEYTAQVLPDGSMTSNYKSPANAPRRRTIELKFSINQKDNELPFASNHQIVVKPENGQYQTPLIIFGQQYLDKEAGIDEALELDVPMTVKLDMSPVFNAFEKDGYYEDLNGDKIYKEDFKGVFMAGNIVPLNFDFENLQEDVQLQDTDGDHIYELTLNINTHDPDRYVKPGWKLTRDISSYPQLKTDNNLVQALYNMALEETVLLSEEDGTFRTGAKWAGVWTRDVSYSIVLGMGMADIQRARKSLLRKAKRSRIIQDTGSGGAWPVSSDRTTWALAAWELYLISGDQLWLDYCYQVISNTVEDDRKVVYNPNNGLYRGESSFLDWRVQTYPRWMDNVDIYSSMNLGTNLVHYRTLMIVSKIAELENMPTQAEKYADWAAQLKKAINQQFWNPEKGYYTQYLYGRYFTYESPKAEALGEAFSVLFDVAEEKSKSVIENTPVLTWGIPCVYPQIPDMRPYHNNGVWPFVQAFWNMSAAKAGNETALEQGLSAFYRASAMFLTNKENMVAENGDFITALNSDRQLWSVAGNLGMIYKIMFGIRFTPDSKMTFSPFIPKTYAGEMQLSNLKIRNKEFTVKINGYGNQVKSFRVDGEESGLHEVSLIGEGKHTVEIKLANNSLKGQINLIDNKFHLKTPETSFDGINLNWTSIEGAQTYEVFKNGELFKTVKDTSIDISGPNAEYTVRAADEQGDVSFLSEPVLHASNLLITSINKFVRDKSISVASSPPDMTEVSKTKNRNIEWSVIVPESGYYKLYFEYSNGNGPWNTDNKCAIRTLWVNGEITSPVIMAQRGLHEWASIGNTNIIGLKLEKGNNQFKLSFEPENENMNFENNKALIGNMMMIKI
ncbi:hypothetical protein [Saccharicrinis sp. 156]|uniref:alpha-L-rhamnosidase-related protein n=1 Tax=Saccharicrinis sp. 156 TaxID=3417574 RepID=UPI003D33AABE